MTVQELMERVQLMDRDLRQESLWVMYELSTLDLDPVAFLELLNEQDDDGDCGFEIAAVH